MPNQTAARSFSVDRSDNVRTLLASAAPNVIARLDRLQNQSRDRYNGIIGQSSESEDLRQERGALQTQLGMMERDILRSGKEPRKSVRTINPETGAEETAWELDPVLDRIQVQIHAINKRLEDISKKRWPPDEFNRVMETLRTLGGHVELVAYEPPIPAKPKATEDTKDIFLSDNATLDMLRTELDRKWAEPRTKTEIRERAHADVKALAKNSEPRLGGLARGSSQDLRGNLRVATPNSRLGWPKENHGFMATPGGAGAKVLETRDGVGLVCWLFEKELLAKLDQVIDEKFPDAGIAEKAKPALIADLEAQIWEQRKLVEESFLLAEASGAKGIKRPAETPVEILIGVEKFGSRRAPGIAAVPEVKPEVADAVASATSKSAADKDTGEDDFG